MNQDDNTQPQKPQPQTIIPSHSPESEPFRYHFDQGNESIIQSENEKPENNTEFIEQLPNPYATTPIKGTSHTSHLLPNISSDTNPPTTKPPSLPLTEDEIETHVHDKDSSAAMHWLALWCLRQLEIYEQSLKQD